MFSTSIKSSMVPVAIPMSFGSVGGKVIVSGIGEVEEDEFFLNLLNEQNVWDPLVLAGKDDVSMKKRFLSRTARYSGLLNILNITHVDLQNPDQLKSLLEGASAWIAFRIPRVDIVPLSKAAVNANIKRVVFTTELTAATINDTTLPEFTEAIQLFQSIGGSFTGIRHGEVIPGDEDFPYEIVNATIPCLESTIERGVLARVVAEILQIEKSSNIECGVSSSSSFAAAYLNVLRSSGLTRREEVEKVLAGGIQRVARLTVNQYAEQKAREEEAKAKAERRKLEIEEEMRKERERMAKLSELVELNQKNPYSDEEAKITETVEQMINKRTEEILKNVWNEYDTRMYTKFSSKLEFYEANREKARQLAEKEIEDQIRLKKERDEENQARSEIMERLIDVNRKQYTKLLALERKEMIYQKQISDAWVKYIFLLLEFTLAQCEEKNILFYNLDEFGQTMLLRSAANDLRKMVNLPEYDVVYDPLDASTIVEKLATKDIGKKYGIDRDSEVIVETLNARYATILKSVAALRGASQIIDLAIETLKRELPAAPPTVNEARRAESLAKQQQVSKSRLESIRNRGQPSTEGDSVVGRL